MTPAIAVDVAMLLPPDVADLAVALNRALPIGESQGLVLDATHLPHVTLAQLFVATERLDALLDRIGTIVGAQGPLHLRVTGGTRGASSVWMDIERSAAIATLHERLMTTVAPFEERHGSALAFDGRDARPADVDWVTGYRRSASFDRFAPHVTIGHAGTPPALAPFEFEARTVAACRLGRFCTCRTVLRKWEVRS